MITIRAFTHGYDLFHPTDVVLWHEYSRLYRLHHHWTDHVRMNGVSVEWHERDHASREKVRRFLRRPWVGGDGCGTRRTMSEYEAYAGVSFKSLRVQDYTRRGLEPPNPPAPMDWAERLRQWQVLINFNREALPARAELASFWYVGVHDAAEQEIHREDLDETGIRTLLAGEGADLCISCTLDSEREPMSWTVWPFVEGVGWLNRLHGRAAVSERAVGTDD